jgi:hypothetical protein
MNGLLVICPAKQHVAEASIVATVILIMRRRKVELRGRVRPFYHVCLGKKDPSHFRQLQSKPVLQRDKQFENT